MKCVVHCSFSCFIVPLPVAARRHQKRNRQQLFLLRIKSPARRTLAPKRGCFSNHTSLARSAPPARRAFCVIGALSCYTKLAAGPNAVHPSRLPKAIFYHALLQCFLIPLSRSFCHLLTAGSIPFFHEFIELVDLILTSDNLGSVFHIKCSV